MKIKLINRFKIASLAILGTSYLEFLIDKLDIIADAIDLDFPEAEEMVAYLENSIIKCADYVVDNGEKIKQQ